VKNYKGQSAVEGLTQRGIAPLSGTPDLKVTSKDFFDLLGSEFMPPDMENVVIVPVESRDDHTAIVAYCIYKPPLTDVCRVKHVPGPAKRIMPG
jgi:hypothetical protein